VDTDVGQAEIGPPTTIALGRVRRPLTRLGDAELLALEFIGDTSPVRHIRETADASGRLVRRALDAGFERVIVDTGGLVQGSIGLALKRAKLRAIDPDVVLIVQRHDESEPLARTLEQAARPEVVRLTPSPAAVARSQTRRREHRERRWREYFTDATAVRVDITRVPLLARRGETLAQLVAGQLLGVKDAAGETAGIARVRAVDAAAGTLVIETPVALERIAGLVPGRATWMG
jgi:polynucleotide 5'-hydroxyl-kinase GRC3/NOL9